MRFGHDFCAGYVGYLRGVDVSQCGAMNDTHFWQAGWYAAKTHLMILAEAEAHGVDIPYD